MTKNKPTNTKREIKVEDWVPGYEKVMSKILTRWKKGGHWYDARDYYLDGEVKEMQFFISRLLKEERQKAYWKRELDDKEEKEINETDEAHRNAEGYCCACGYDMAVMEKKIKQREQKVAGEVREKLDLLPAGDMLDRICIWLEKKYG